MKQLTFNKKQKLDSTVNKDLLTLETTTSCKSTMHLRQCTVFWLKWPVHDLVLVIPPPPVIKVFRNTRSCSKLGGAISNGREEGGRYCISQTCDQQRFEARKVIFFCLSVSTFLQLVVAPPLISAFLKDLFCLMLMMYSVVVARPKPLITQIKLSLLSMGGYSILTELF